MLHITLIKRTPKIGIMFYGVQFTGKQSKQDTKHYKFSNEIITLHSNIDGATRTHDCECNLLPQGGIDRFEISTLATHNLLLDTLKFLCCLAPCMYSCQPPTILMGTLIRLPYRLFIQRETGYTPHAVSACRANID